MQTVLKVAANVPGLPKLFQTVLGQTPCGTGEAHHAPDEAMLDMGRGMCPQYTALGDVGGLGWMS